VSLGLAELSHGLFYYLVRGLEGAADFNRDGIVTLQELYEYVEQQVSRKARAAGGKQSDVMKGELEGILPLTDTPDAGSAGPARLCLTHTAESSRVRASSWALLRRGRTLRALWSQASPASWPVRCRWLRARTSRPVRRLTPNARNWFENEEGGLGSCARGREASGHLRRAGTGSGTRVHRGHRIDAARRARGTCT